jgi:hypothetical protein
MVVNAVDLMGALVRTELKKLRDQDGNEPDPARWNKQRDRSLPDAETVEAILGMNWVDLVNVVTMKR